MKLVSVMTTESSGGAEFAAVELLDALVDRGYDVKLLTNRADLRRDTRVPTTEIAIGPKLSRSTYRQVALGFPRLARGLSRALAAESPYDVLLVHYKKEQLLTLGLWRRRKRADRPLCVWAEWGPVPFELRKGLPNALYRRAAGKADLVLAISAGTRQSVIDAGVPVEKVIVLANAVRTGDIQFTEQGRQGVRDRLGIPGDAFVVGCVSRFHPKKRNDVVVEAVLRLGPNAHVVLAGDGETEASLRAQAAPLGARAHFIPTPTSDIADVYSAFDVSVFCPSPTEGAPRAVILAMLACRPVVSTGAEGVADLLTAGGVILDPENDPDGLAEVLRRYEGNPALRERDGIAGRALVEEVNASENVAARLDTILQEALARRRS